MLKIYDLLTVLESSTVTSPHFSQARTMIREELETIAESIEDSDLRNSIMNVALSWRKLDSVGTLEGYVNAVRDLKALLQKLA